MWLIFAFSIYIAMVVDWVAVYKNNLKIIYIAKPAVMILLIWATLFYALPLNETLKFFIVGLFFSLLGDIFLMLPNNKIIYGLSAFLIAHIAYIAALGLIPISSTHIVPTLILTLFLIPVTIKAIQIISLGLKKAGRDKLIIPVGIYASILSVVVLAGLSYFFNNKGSTLVAFLMAGGVLSFFVSDLILALDRFVGKISNGRLKVHISYHIAQILLTLGFIIKYSYL